MSTFLQLAQRLRQEVGISGTGPATVVGQTGEMRRVVDWINSAWLEIQEAHSQWDWMRAEFSFSTVASQQSYTSLQAGISSRFGRWCLDGVGLKTSGRNDETELIGMPYSEFRRAFILGPQPEGRPVVVTIKPDKSLALGHTPNAVFVVRGEYWKAPQSLSADADEPEMPSFYHEAILHRAMMMYGRYAAASEVYEDASAKFAFWMNKLTQDQLPNVSLPEALA